MLGLLPRAEGMGGIVRLLAIWALVLVASAASGPMLARLARRETEEG